MRVPLVSTGTVIPAGHVLRLALAGAHWPMMWPSPEPATLTVHGGRLVLPAPDPAAEVAVPALPAPRAEPAPNPVRSLEGPPHAWTQTRDHGAGRTENRCTGGWETVWDGGRSYGCNDTRCLIDDRDPLSCRVVTENVAECEHPGVRARCEGRLEQWCDRGRDPHRDQPARDRDGEPFFERTGASRSRATCTRHLARRGSPPTAGVPAACSRPTSAAWLSRSTCGAQRTADSTVFICTADHLPGGAAGGGDALDRAHHQRVAELARHAERDRQVVRARRTARRRRAAPRSPRTTRATPIVSTWIITIRDAFMAAIAADTSAPRNCVWPRAIAEPRRPSGGYVAIAAASAASATPSMRGTITPCAPASRACAIGV